MNANIQKAQDVMRTFPKEVETPDRQDFDDLAALYKAKEKQVAIYDNAIGAMKEQLQLVARHVSTCYDIWVQVRSGMTWKTHAIQDLYALVVRARPFQAALEPPPTSLQRRAEWFSQTIWRKLPTCVIWRNYGTRASVWRMCQDCVPIRTSCED